MATEVKLPRLGQGMESGIVSKWLKAEGDTVEKGEPLYEVETDKATQEVEAELSGILLKIAVSEGEVPVGQTVAVIGEAGEVVESAPAEPARPEPDTSGARHQDTPEPARPEPAMSGARHQDTAEPDTSG